MRCRGLFGVPVDPNCLPPIRQAAVPPRLSIPPAVCLAVFDRILETTDSPDALASVEATSFSEMSDNFILHRAC